MTYVTIDYSLNSPGVCIFYNNKYTFLSYIKPKLGTKKELLIQEEMSTLPDVVYLNQPDFKKESEYSSIEFAKINRYVNIADNLIEQIKSLTPNSTSYKFAFEGTSYGSKGGTNNMIDMAAGAAIFKMKIIEAFDPEDILTVAPSTIKKFAGKGNMNKSQLWIKFLENVNSDKIIETSKFLQFCRKEIGETSKIPKPFDDLVDAYFLNGYLRS